MDILLYGLGRMTEKIEKIVCKNHTVIGYSDSFASIDFYNGKKFFQPKEIKNLNCDFIIITVSERKTAWQIQQDLINNYDVEKEKIIPFAIYAKNEIVENTMTALEDIDGIILGNSHAFYGILPEYLDGNFVSLACPSQDIYYNYKAFQRYVLRGSRRKDLTVIFDLYDYNFFNSDVSLTKGLFDYISWGGVIDKRNFDQNTHYSMGFEKELFNARCMLTELTEKEKRSMDILFGTYQNPLVVDMNTRQLGRWDFIKTNAPLQAEKFVSDIVTKKFENTIQANIEILDSFIREARSVDSNCKIIFTLIPRYITMEKALSFAMEKWKKDFESILEDFQKKWKGIYFLNYKNRTEISGNNHFYWDVNHLNAMGGRCFTAMLNDDISKINRD